MHVTVFKSFFTEALFLGRFRLTGNSVEFRPRNAHEDVMGESLTQFTSCARGGNPVYGVLTSDLAIIPVSHFGLRNMWKGN